MKIKTIKSSELGLQCWSILRFFDECYLCHRVLLCKLPWAKNGRIQLMLNKLDLQRKIMEETVDSLDAAINEKTNNP